MSKFLMLSFYLALAGILTLSGCGSDQSKTRESSKRVEDKPTPPNVPSDESGAEVDPTSFEYFGVIREFGESKNAALFGLQPQSGVLEIQEIRGPGFIKTYQVGKLNSQVLDKLFQNTPLPLSSTEKQAILTDFEGATLIYAEGYPGQLCSNQEIEYKINLLGSLDGKSFEASLVFVATPQADGDCQFQLLGVMAGS